MNRCDVQQSLRLNLGCGYDLRPGYVNIDAVSYGENLVHDLNHVPYPFPDHTFDEVVCRHILEHLREFHPVVRELHRICRPGARILVAAPFFLSTKFYGEPDHRIPFSIRTFDNYEDLRTRRLKWYEGWKRHHRTNFNSGVWFEIMSKRFHVSNIPPLSWLDLLVNLEPVLYERLCGHLFPPEEVLFELRVVKP